MTRVCDFEVGGEADPGFAAAATGIRERLADSVRRATEGAETVGVLLSGGLDSAIVAHEAVRAGVEVVAIHHRYRLPGFDEETRAAEAVAGCLGIRLEVLDTTESLGPGGDYLHSVLAGDTPLSHGHVPAYVATSRLGPMRLLLGFGADELFACPPGRARRVLGAAVLNPLRAGSPFWQLRRSPDTAPSHGLGVWRRLPPIWLTRPARNALLELQRQAAAGYRDGFPGSSAPAPDALISYMAVHWALDERGVNAKVEGILGPAGVDVALPFIEPALVRYCLRLGTPYRWQMQRGHLFPKALLRFAYRDLLPRPVVGRIWKTDYGIPARVFVARNRLVVKEVLDADSILASRGVIDPVAVAAIIDGEAWNLRAHAEDLTDAASVELWLRRRVA